MTLLIFLVVLSILILVHEFGHFFVAKRAGVKVEEFGLGLPVLPKLISIRYKETLYSIYPVLFGGFVKLYGEEGTVTRDAPRAFSSKSKKVRAGIIIAGVIMNFLLAVVSFSILYSVLGIPRKIDIVRVEGVVRDSPAQNSDIRSGDIILSVDGENIESNEKFIQLIENRRGKEVKLGIKKENGQVWEVRVVPRVTPPEGEGPLGVAITDSEQYFPPWWQRPFVGAWFGIQEAVGWGVIVVSSIGTLFTTLFTTAALPKDLAGPVGIFQITGSVAQQGGFLAILKLLGILSVNLAILNVIPFPALDGGRLMFVGIEAVLGKRARGLITKIEQKANLVGFAFLIALIIAITLQDIRRLLGE